MKPSRILTRFGLIIVNIATVIYKLTPRFALWLADGGDWISDKGIKLACYDY